MNFDKSQIDYQYSNEHISKILGYFKVFFFLFKASFVLFCFVFLFMAAPMTYGSSWARG